MKYFKHETRARNGKKLRKLLMKYGAEGYGLYWYIVELIGEPIDRNNLNFELEHDAEILGHDLKIDPMRVEEILRFMVSLGLLESAGNSQIYCFGLARRIETSLVRSPDLKAIQARLAKGEQYQLLAEPGDLLALASPKSEPLRMVRNGSEPLPGHSALDLDLDLDLDLEKFTTTTTSAVALKPDSSNFAVEAKTAESLMELGVTAEFLDEYAVRFVSYWSERGTKLEAWQSLFIEQCWLRYRTERLGETKTQRAGMNG